ncbi:hypothetical protein [Flavobacterium capsici]|uniref:Uncharacterized protein n=1 Tax=Flavobacterium capsici TaxID=3075618 RepID=A0AA96EX82_9FLAO|nr:MULTISPECIES: hypothetical protein [unclassified Flavobacterium]WNM18878.1 hypothetical protein RN608_12800 [Flavobacterium sp. PMR2A8]WNM22928.1 hypothetical protein RN605_06100 [Flavobacterium sp. PMTSA4]
MKKITLVSQTKWILLSAILFSFLSQAKTVLPIETNRIWLNVTGAQGAFSQTLYGYRTGAIDGFDEGVDEAFFYDGAIALASLLGDVRYVIQFKGLSFSIEDVCTIKFFCNKQWHIYICNRSF